MSKRVQFSLATKCQLLFGIAVIIILAAALIVVWQRMEAMVERVPQKRAQDFANAWLADEIQLGGALTPLETALQPLDPNTELTLTVVKPEVLAAEAEKNASEETGENSDTTDNATEDDFLQSALSAFETQIYRPEFFAVVKDSLGATYYRYARAVRQSDIDQLANESDPAQTTELSNADNPITAVLIINLRDSDAAREHLLNIVYIVVAGLVSGLLAIAVFWFITTRLVLSPLRVLRKYAEQVSSGDLSVRSEISTGDEFEQLSDLFNQMLDALKDNTDTLRGVNKSLDLKLIEMAESNVALYEANKMKGEFLANVSHELRTPLHSIIGFAEVLGETLADRTGPIDEKRKRYAENIVNSSKRLLDLINDLLDLAKIEAGRIELNIDTLQLPDICEGLINLIRPQADKGNVQLRLKVEPSLPLVQTDAGKLQQILFNFISNAVKFTPADGTVTLTATQIPPTRPGQIGQIKISVNDTGPGIALEDQARIFDKFTQLDPTVTRQQGGTGLGLTICRELATMLQARIEIDSMPGEGATFTLILPIAYRPKAAPLMPPSPPA